MRGYTLIVIPANLRNILSHSEEETKQIARNLAQKLKAPAIVCLYGNLGTGKTVFVKGLAEAFGIPGKSVKSPTYTFVREYRAGGTAFYHFDFYRIQEGDDLMSRDLEEIFRLKNAVVVMEWPEHIVNALPRERKDVFFKYVDSSTRSITIPDD